MDLLDTIKKAEMFITYADEKGFATADSIFSTALLEFVTKDKTIAHRTILVHSLPSSFEECDNIFVHGLIGNFNPRRQYPITTPNGNPVPAVVLLWDALKGYKFAEEYHKDVLDSFFERVADEGIINSALGKFIYALNPLSNKQCFPCNSKIAVDACTNFFELCANPILLP